MKRMDDGVVALTVIRSEEEAAQFFNESGQGEPASMEEQNAL